MQGPVGEPHGCPRGTGARRRWLSPGWNSGLHRGGGGRGWLKAERWVMRHGIAAGSAAGPRLQEKLDRGRQVPVAAAPLIPIRGIEEIPKIALRAWDAKAAQGDRGPCATEPPWLAVGPGAGGCLQPTALAGTRVAPELRRLPGAAACPDTAASPSWAGALPAPLGWHCARGSQA